MKPRLLDLFCGAGGATRGYQFAGFHVTGVDIKEQPNYCGDDFVCLDAISFLDAYRDSFDAFHASPPCQAFSRAKHLRKAQGGSESQSANALMLTLCRYEEMARPWVIENVPGAPIAGLVLCGSMFGLKVRRHRIFCSNVIPEVDIQCRHREQGRPIGVYHKMNDNIPRGGRTARTLEEGRDAMGIDWMTWNELKEAIPPSYTEFVGREFLMPAVKA